MRRAYGYDVDEASVSAGLICRSESLTQQHFKDDADINVILRKFGQGHDIPQGYNPPMYGDFDTADDYRSMLDRVRAAAESFMELPADVRGRFGNDPAQLLDFVGNDENRAEAERMGLVQPRDSGKLDVTVPGDTKVSPPPSPIEKEKSNETVQGQQTQSRKAVSQAVVKD